MSTSEQLPARFVIGGHPVDDRKIKSQLTLLASVIDFSRSEISFDDGRRTTMVEKIVSNRWYL